MKPRYIVEAESLLGLKEIKGKLTSEKVKELFADAGHPEVVTDEVPWCAAFVGACLARSNQPNTGTLLARDYRSPSYLKNCDDHGKKPVMYSIGVMTRGNSKWEGHVGFVVDFDAKHVWLLGGNQNDKVMVERFPRNRFIGFATPQEKKADITPAQLVSDSRRMGLQKFLEWGQVTMAAAGTAVWQYSADIVNLAEHNMGKTLLVLLASTWIISKGISYMSIREYREGRYLPKKQWD